MTELPNLVLIVVDAYRQDHLSLFDPGYAFTRRLGSRCSTWLRFDKAFSAAPWTLPACTSLLTGLDAGSHLRFDHQEPPLTAPTFAEMLNPAYVSTGFVNNGVIGISSELNRGFDTYRFIVDHQEVFTATHEFLREAAVADHPYFLFFHTNLPHDFYMEKSRPYFEECFGSDGWYELGRRVLNWEGMTDDERERARRVYDACVAKLDLELDRLLEAIDLDTTVVVITADHGEGLDHENARVHHGGRVHDDVIRVPLLVHVPPGHAASAALEKAVRRPVGHIDVAPTLLSLSRSPVPDSLDGRDLTESREADTPRALNSEDRRYLYTRGLHRMNMNKYGKNTTRWQRTRNRAMRATVLNRFSVQAFVEGEHKLILLTLVPGRLFPTAAALPVLRKLVEGGAVFIRAGTAVVALELYDLDSDPGERVNLLPRFTAADVNAVMPSVGRERLALGGRETDVADVLARL